MPLAEKHSYLIMNLYATTEVITEFFLSNFTGSPIDVTIIFFKKDNAGGSPNILTDSGRKGIGRGKCPHYTFTGNMDEIAFV
ncbi:MAG TPA: hypothetical protein ACFYD4_00730 [Candidatus Wunengus sp. YC61]|uniref:hypothetical protein n=1 Tax=Candidatus Wunengus sp. YC61 TaxID=3367698 RepID=UPI004024D866